ncbi:MAG TPA: S4 domain-containing protein, partial [Dehalococcoidales bacterium]|nr:S4 domain-containing protein [Dehalococcoidales bacterium]
MNRSYSFTADAPGARLDKFLAEKCPGLSRTHAQKLIAEGLVKVNGQTARASLKLESGDRVDFTIPPEAPSHLTPEEIPLKIINED